MLEVTVLTPGAVRVIDYRCTHDGSDVPYVELHAGHSVSYVRDGTFGSPRAFRQAAKGERRVLQDRIAHAL